MGALFVTGAVGLAAVSSGCSSEVKAYEKKGAPTGKAAQVPAPPTLPQKPKKDGDSYTVFGAVHDLHSKVHSPDVKGKKLTIVGYVVKTNAVKCQDDSKALEEQCAPACSMPDDIKKGTPADCKAPAPTFWIADSLEEKTEMIPVLGWASNFAGIKGAIEEMDKATSLEKQAEVKFMDQQGRVLPNPLPAVGAKVAITCTYGTTSRVMGTSSEPKYGVLGCGNDYVIKVIQPAPEQANLPGMKPRKELKAEKK
ncbi:MAG: hypothetical protein HOW73_08890 [Polyangiaceae bacterium]|nr:hypothetical protein [Polyangiaceae bacterium]